MVFYPKTVFGFTKNEIYDMMFNQLGVEVVIMEVSSQSLKLDRVSGSEFDVVAFTNFSNKITFLGSSTTQISLLFLN